MIEIKENKYDHEDFYSKYSQLPRSREGLTAAGEWHQLQKLLPDFAGKRVLDIGCGFGWHCIYAAQHGAKQVTGIDISANMLAIAKEKTTAPNVQYLQMAMEDIDFAPGSFDVIISSLAFHYTPDFEKLCAKICALLAPSGSFIFSVEHPIFTAKGDQHWYYDEQNNCRHWPVDNYFDEGKRNAVFLGESVEKYHRTLTTYINCLLQSGFLLKALVEPQPSEEMLAAAPEMADELRRPMMLLIAAQKA